MISPTRKWPELDYTGSGSSGYLNNTEHTTNKFPVKLNKKYPPKQDGGRLDVLETSGRFSEAWSELGRGIAC